MVRVIPPKSPDPLSLDRLKRPCLECGHPHRILPPRIPAMNAFCKFTGFCCCALFAAHLMAQQPLEISQDDSQIKVSTDKLEAIIRKQGYVTGTAAGSLVDKQTGFRDAGFGLDIVDWIMEPGSDAAYRDQLPKEMVYFLGTCFPPRLPIPLGR
jgi:hypothetical protein